MFRESFKKSLLSYLDYDIFRFEDFKIIMNDEKNMMICYDEYYFSIEIDSYKMKCYIAYIPGYILNCETKEMSLNTFTEEAKRHIRNWLDRVKEELLNPIQQRFISNHLEQFKEEIQEKLQTLDESCFSKEEGEQLKQKLEELERLFFKESEEKKEINDELKHMKSEMEFLKATVDTLSKKKWLKNAMVKIWAWGQKEENKKLMQAGFETIKTITQLDASDIK